MAPPRLATHRATVADDAVDRLFRWLSIPSISADPAHAGDVGASAEWLVDAALEAGFTRAEILPTAGHPAVYAQCSGAPAGAPRVLVYGHHDVQPVDPLDAWTDPPLDPVIVDGVCRARGAIDDKGQVAYHLEAVRALLALDGALPVEVKLLIEGEEEIGSPNFEDLLVAHRDLLSCDVIVVSDTGMIAPDIPSVDVAMRGLVALTVTLTTSTTEVHSGLFGGAVPNPLHHLSRLLADLHDGANRVSIPGFYDEVRELTTDERASLAAQPFDDDEFRHLAGVEFLEGERDRSTLERIGSRPTAEVVGITGGYGGEGMKTIVPAAATAKIAFRLVPDQDPTTVMGLVESWLAERVHPGIRVGIEWHGGVAPAHTPTDHWAFTALRRAITTVWGTEPLLTRIGGSGPEETLGRVLDAPVIFLGVGLPGDRIHAPNERMVMEQFWRGFAAAGELYHELAAARPREDAS